LGWWGCGCGGWGVGGVPPPPNPQTPNPQSPIPQIFNMIRKLFKNEIQFYLNNIINTYKFQENDLVTLIIYKLQICLMLINPLTESLPE